MSTRVDNPLQHRTSQPGHTTQSAPLVFLVPLDPPIGPVPVPWAPCFWHAGPMQSRQKPNRVIAPPLVSTRVDNPGPPPKKTTAKGPGWKVTADMYELARTAYLEGGSPAAVRQATGFSVDVCNRLIDSGIPSLSLPSLRDVARSVAADADKRLKKAERHAVEQDTKAEALAMAKQLEARAKAREDSLAVQTKAIGDAQASRNEELKLVRANRNSAMVLAGVNANLLRASVEISQDVIEDYRANRKTMKMREKLGALRTIASIVQRTAHASQISVNMERLLMGEPTAILGRSDVPSAQDMTVEEAEKWFEIAKKAHGRRAARKQLVDTTGESIENDESEAVDELVEDL